MGVYQDIKNAIQNQLVSHFQSKGKVIDVYKVPYQSIPVFPAVTLELDLRRKAKKGLGVKQLEVALNVWVYADILDAEDAEAQCFEIAELVEEALEKDKTLGGVVHYLNTDEEIDFGTVQNGEASFLQGAKISLQVRKLVTK